MMKQSKITPDFNVPVSQCRLRPSLRACFNPGNAQDVSSIVILYLPQTRKLSQTNWYVSDGVLSVRTIHDQVSRQQ